MLQSLTIKNYALIENLNISFDKGLSIITGETGAGKSILLGGLSLILGQRADVAVLSDKTKNCVIEGNFDVKKYKLKSFFEENELDYDELTIIRRVINPSGKSRAFINDFPVNLNILKSLGERLVDVHSQHNNLLLNSFEFQIYIVDSYAKHADLLSEYKSNYKALKSAQNKLKNLTEEAEKEKADFDFFNFQYKELNEAGLKSDEQEELEAEYEKLAHAEEISLNLSQIHELLTNEEISVVGSLKTALNSAQHISKFFKDAIEYSARIDTALIDLRDLANEIEIKSNDIIYDPERLSFIKQRLDLIYSLQQKHKVNTIDNLIEIYNTLKIRVENISSYDEQIESIKNEIENLKALSEKQANEISKHRQTVAPEIEKRIENMIKQLGMPDARFKILQENTPELTIHGKDKVKFVFSANKQVVLQDITKVASGGEMSRVMLGIKGLISESVALPTIIFDEIDTGVSGDIADKMGTIIKQMAKNMQIINITHLPQVAAKGDAHYFVFKESGAESTITNIKRLSDDERITEIAKMLSGQKLTDAALSNAKELLATAKR